MANFPKTAYQSLNLNKQVGINVAIARAQLNLSRNELAKLLHCSYDAIRDIEEGIVQIDMDKIELLANILNCEISYLIPLCNPDV